MLILFSEDLSASTRGKFYCGEGRTITNKKPSNGDHKEYRRGRCINSPVSYKYSYSDRYDGLISRAAQNYSLDASLIKAVIKVESNFDSRAVSPKGAVGLMQLMPRTAARMGVKNRYDERENIMGGSKYLRFLLDLFSDKKLALAGYNAGENAVIKYGYRVPPYKETKNYVSKVLSHYNKLKRVKSKPLVSDSVRSKDKYSSVSYRETPHTTEFKKVN